MAHTTSRSPVAESMVIRGAYFFVHEKRTKNPDKSLVPEDQQQYEFTGLVPKLSDIPEQCANYMFFSNLAMSAVAGCADWKGQWPADGRETLWPIKDGDKSASKYPERQGHWVIKFSTRYPPRVLLKKPGLPLKDWEIPARRIGNQDLYKSGDYCVVSTYALTYDNKSRGVKYDFEGICFVAPGEVIGTAQRTVDQMFGNTAAAIPASAAPGPSPVSVPQMQVAPPPAPSMPSAIPSTPQVASAPGYPAPGMSAPPGPPMPPMAPSVGLPPLPGR